MKKTKQIINKITPQEYHQQLNACINCIYENICTLPFPINLSECCEKYKKKNKTNIIYYNII